MAAEISARLGDFIRSHFETLSLQKTLNEQQKMFYSIAELWLNSPEKVNAQKLRDLKTLAKAEQISIKAENAKIAARKLITKESEKARKERTHNLINAAGLLGLAGLLDKQTGKPLTSNERLLGALIELAQREPSEQEKRHWDELGTLALTEAKSKTKR